MPQQRNGVFRPPQRRDLLFGLDTLHLHQLAALLRLPLFLVLLEVHKQKQNISDAQHKSQKFRHNRPAGIQQLGINIGGVIVQIIDQRHQPQDGNILGGLRQKLRGGIGNIPDKQVEHQRRHRGAHRIVDPFFIGKADRHQPHPFAHLAAQVGRQHRKGAVRHPVFIVQVQKNDQRQVDDQGVDPLGAGRPPQQVADDAQHPRCGGKPQQRQHVAAVHADAQKGSRNIHAEQQRGGIMQDIQHVFRHRFLPFSYSSRNICAKYAS